MMNTIKLKTIFKKKEQKNKALFEWNKMSESKLEHSNWNLDTIFGIGYSERDKSVLVCLVFLNETRYTNHLEHNT